jgi:uncharacterized protein (TIGR01777 family)
MQKRLLLAGGTGLIGTAIKKQAEEDGWEVSTLSRSAEDDAILWDPSQQYISLNEPMTFDAIINLAGASIAGGRWTASQKKIILESRLQSCSTLEKYLKDGLLKTEVYIGASAIGIYGDRGVDSVDEDSVSDSRNGWLARTTLAWEEAHDRINRLGIRTVIIRIGLVLSLEGGAMKEMIQTAPFGFLGYFGNGQQIWPWIHIDDVASIFIHAITHQKMEGVYLATSPFAVTNKRITSAIGKSYSPARLVLPVPEILLSILLGEMHLMLMQSCKCYPTKLIASGYQFRFLKIEDAVGDLMKHRK